MKKIMIDMDNVICEGGYLNVVNKFLKTNYKIDKNDNIKVTKKGNIKITNIGYFFDGKKIL